MAEWLALTLVATAGLFFVALGGASLALPARASGFLLAFAGSPRKHYAELAVRILVGAAFLAAAPRSLLPAAFSVFGWLLLGTTAVLLFVPWHWHRRFAVQAVPVALRFLPLVGACALTVGGLVLWAVSAAVAAGLEGAS